MRRLRDLLRPGMPSTDPGQDLDATPARAVDVASGQDPPFTYRARTDGSTLRHVLNDVYARNRTGKKWHRIYQYGQPNPSLERYGRAFLFACGGAGSEFEPSDGWIFLPLAVRTGVPDANEICTACASSDAKYGKGEIPNKARWDH